ncbi:DUF445 domain-containing protein [Cohnella hashimotonis]|uniref:DUF445 domain-containing protein n=1 Tax=Cohnella hashimotonis TaxID=2826895 RepID=A0ABT6TNY2_9BACL|nr:DUF445 domain-containing protein [Cohnella hashimotonis]MDI4648558.1 DUF445 domain-containing protein [Cohnella hashimotonis]
MPGQAKHTAAISLGIMGAGFLATFPVGGWGGALLHGGFEAGLVGGLADWFAVTALFRHPLGIPIPHTALLPRNRDKVVRSLIQAIETELLTKESIVTKTAEFKIGERLLDLLETHREDAAAVAVRVSEFALERLPMDRIVPMLARALESKLRELDTAGLLRKISDEALARGYEEKALAFLIDKAGGLASREETRRQLGVIGAAALQNLQVGGLMGFAVNAFISFMDEEKIGGLLQNAIVGTLAEMQQREDHPLREMLLETLRGAIRNLPESPSVLAELEGWKARLAEGGAIERQLFGWLEGLRVKALDFVREQRFTDDYVLPAISGLLASLRANPQVIELFQTWVQERITGFVERNHWKIGKLVKENIDKLDNDALIEMMEDKIGGDLQWIRVNGAVCGFLIGLALEGINLLA